MPRSPDVIVVGTGVFGAWTAYHLCRTGRSVTLVDAYGPGNPRGSSGGKSRIIRIGYGNNEIYSHSAVESLKQWQTLPNETPNPLFVKTGVLLFGRDNDPLIDATTLTLKRLGVNSEFLTRQDLTTRFPQFRLGSVTRAVFEPESGVILARRAVNTVVHEAMRCGVEYRLATVRAPHNRKPLVAVTTTSGELLPAETFVFACGPWLSKLFPNLIGPLIHTTRQEVFFFGYAPGDRRFVVPTMPAWVDFRDGVYGLPDIEGRGIKIGLDQHGPPFDPDSGQRLPSPVALLTARQATSARIPLLTNAELLDARVCQYSNTWSGDFLIDRHPDFENLWLVGGGSGHGFKHGPSVGAYVVAMLDETRLAEPRFTLASKRTEPAREVY